MTEPSSIITIFADHKSERLKYVLDFVFLSKNQRYSLITNLSELDSNTCISIGYTTQNITAKLMVTPSGLLNENHICSDWKINYLDAEKAWIINEIPDNLSIIFYFLSRYEEYTDKSRDHHGRFSAQQSILYQKKQLHLPWCDLIVKKIWDNIGLDINSLIENYKTILTYDIDIAWAYKNKPFWRSSANLLKNIVKPNLFIERLSVMFNKAKDPYDTFSIIKENAKKHPSILFFLLGDYGPLDKNQHWKNKKLQSLIKSFSKSLKVGIHPSYKSFLNSEKVRKEQSRLASIINKEVTLSRQHYLRISFPDSYQLLNRLNIIEDFTMGYADQYGFRASTSYSFPFFDLQKNSATELQITPFCVMDGTLMDYLKISPSESIDIIQSLKKTIKLVGGQFVPIWHNHTIGNTKEAKGWQAVYNACIEP